MDHQREPSEIPSRVRRLFAFGIDCLLIWVLCLACWFGLEALDLRLSDPVGHLLGYGIFVGYFWLLEGTWKGAWEQHASPGKRIFHLQVCNQEGEAPSYRQAFLRALLTPLFAGPFSMTEDLDQGSSNAFGVVWGFLHAGVCAGTIYNAGLGILYREQTMVQDFLTQTKVATYASLGDARKHLLPRWPMKGLLVVSCLAGLALFILDLRSNANEHSEEPNSASHGLEASVEKRLGIPVQIELTTVSESETTVSLSPGVNKFESNKRLLEIKVNIPWVHWGRRAQIGELIGEELKIGDDDLASGRFVYVSSRWGISKEEEIEFEIVRPPRSATSQHSGPTPGSELAAPDLEKNDLGGSSDELDKKGVKPMPSMEKPVDGTSSRGSLEHSPETQRDPEPVGALPKDVIQEVIKSHLPQIRECYETGLIRAPGISGKVGTEFVIAADGHVRTAKISTSTLGNPAVESCIVSRIETWRFPEPEGEG